ncbi:GNAT family N-acetyltransferase [Pseudochrobactrum sp. HB0163]|uniref:GNAT family N-acetyltransferase n=1 Tax=Pseudochrobactrum sp. HB0163 TaxID=3450708 RepID=UPI003F6DDB93
MCVRIETCSGSRIAPFIDDLARLRIRVFRDFPYLYDGDMAYETNYIATYANSPGSFFVLALDGDKVIGASTGIPMQDETEAFKAPFAEHGYKPDKIFYFGESVLLPAYRGAGIGVRFFEEREAHARQSGQFEMCCFCAVERPQDHPARPHNYQPLDQFWNKRGFFHKPELRTFYSWRDVGNSAETAKPMSFWIKELN